MTEKTTCNHCWHDTGIRLASNPPQTQEVCCYCGKYQHRIIGHFPEMLGGHGKYLPKLGQWVAK